jgi:hypothetical protein
MLDFDAVYYAAQTADPYHPNELEQVYAAGPHTPMPASLLQSLTVCVNLPLHCSL